MSSWFIPASPAAPCRLPFPAPGLPGPDPLAPGRVRVFAVPYAGRGASLFFPWRAAAPAWLDLVAVQLPGREGRIAEPALDRIDAIVAALAQAIEPELHGPYILFGHSMGALVIYELARALRRQRATAPLALVLSGRRAPTVPNPDPPMHGLSDAGFVEAMRARYDGIPQVVLEQPELMRMLLPTLRRDIEAIETYVHRPEPPLALPFLLYGGEDDRQTPQDSLAAWRPLTSGPATLRLFPGGHFYLQTQQAALLHALGQDLVHLLPGYGVRDAGSTAASLGGGGSSR